MSIRGRKVSLREIERGDLETLWHWRNNPDFIQSCSVRRNAVEVDEFNEELSSDFLRDRHEQYLIYKNIDYKHPLGTIYSYRYNSIDGHIFVTIYLAKEYQQKGYGVRAAALYFQHLFETLSLFKIYIEVYEYNRLSLDPLLKAGAKIEGCFLGHRLHDGRRWNLLRLAIYADQMDQIRRMAQLDKNGPTI